MHNIWALTLWFLLWYFIAVRGMIRLVIDYMLNRSNRKKRKKGQNIFDWFFYTRFKDIIPKVYRVYYYFSIVGWIVACVLIVVFALLNCDDLIVELPMFIYIIVHLCWGGGIFLRWYDWKKGDFNPGKTLQRPRRNSY